MKRSKQLLLAAMMTTACTSASASDDVLDDETIYLISQANLQTANDAATGALIGSWFTQRGTIKQLGAAASSRPVVPVNMVYTLPPAITPTPSAIARGATVGTGSATKSPSWGARAKRWGGKAWGGFRAVVGLRKKGITKLGSKLAGSK